MGHPDGLQPDGLQPSGLYTDDPYADDLAATVCAMLITRHAPLASLPKTTPDSA
jgi:hypothetical protein